MSKAEDCRRCGISVRTLNRRLEKGMSYDEALNYKNKRWSVTDSEGNEYTSLKNMAEAKGLSYDSLLKNVKKGLSPGEAAEATENNKRLPYGHHVGPDGREYKSREEMCAAYGINRATYESRIKRGMSKKEALEVDTRVTYIDAKGSKYDTRKAMCEANGISMSTYSKRKKRGVSNDELFKCSGRKGYTDLNGQKFNSLTALCKANGLNRSTIKERLKTMSIEQAIRAENKRGGKRIVSPYGIEYESEKAMCEDLGVNYHTYRARVYKLHWPIEKALEKEEKAIVTDHKGNMYTTEAEMCKAYGIPSRRYSQRILQGWSKEAALETPVRYAGLKNFHGFQGKFIFVSDEGIPYYGASCKHCGYEHILSKEEMIQHESIHRSEV